MSTQSLKFLDESADGVEFEPRDYEFERENLNEVLDENLDESVVSTSKNKARIEAKQRAETFKDHQFKKK